MTDASSPALANLRLPAELRATVDAALRTAVDERWAARIWQRDVSVWTEDDHVASLIADRLGWLDAPAAFREQIEELRRFAAEVREDGVRRAVVAGMGGSSLAPEVLARSYGIGDRGMPVDVLDSTDPAAVSRALVASADEPTLHLIASKSGTTTESLSFLEAFWAAEEERHDDSAAVSRHFVAITDPGKSVAAIPRAETFRHAFLNPPDIGGRYSALSYVGLVPAALLGIDLAALLDGAVGMAERCRGSDGDNPGVYLGTALASLAREGRDKLTFVTQPEYASFGAWAEQLVAESTGKHGVGIVPIDLEPAGDPAAYDGDRVFVRISDRSAERWRSETGPWLDALEGRGHPVIDLVMQPDEGLGGEFFRWEFATAVAGAGLGINPFDEPNVTESKDNTRRVLDGFRESGSLPAEEILAEAPPLRLSGDAPMRITATHANVERELARHLDRVKPNGYVAFHAYIASSPERDALLAEMRRLVRDAKRRATTGGYGPRFLHSTGQLHKGGPRSGCFIQLVSGHPEDVPIPGAQETFGTLIDAQALGDFASLEGHELPVLRVHLSDDPDAGLAALRAALERAL